jgi:transaldolase
MTTGGRFRLFLDSADVTAWHRLLPLGLFHGVTTNPTLLARAGVPCRLDAFARLAGEARGLGCSELHCQAWGKDAAALAACGVSLAAHDPALVLVKLPATRDGFAAGAVLRAQNMRVTMTAVYTPAQALASAALGATYAAHYYGRISDADATIAAMHAVLRTGGDQTRLLVASLRRPEDIAHLAARGCDTFTVAPAVAEAMVTSEASKAASDAFARDAADK